MQALYLIIHGLGVIWLLSCLAARLLCCFFLTAFSLTLRLLLLGLVVTDRSGQYCGVFGFVDQAISMLAGTIRRLGCGQAALCGQATAETDPSVSSQEQVRTHHKILLDFLCFGCGLRW